jgi:hypothetical protein
VKAATSAAREVLPQDVPRERAAAMANRFIRGSPPKNVLVMAFVEESSIG